MKMRRGISERRGREEGGGVNDGFLGIASSREGGSLVVYSTPSSIHSTFNIPIYLPPPPHFSFFSFSFLFTNNPSPPPPSSPPPPPANNTAPQTPPNPSTAQPDSDNSPAQFCQTEPRGEGKYNLLKVFSRERNSGVGVSGGGERCFCKGGGIGIGGER